MIYISLTFTNLVHGRFVIWLYYKKTGIKKVIILYSAKFKEENIYYFENIKIQKLLNTLAKKE